MNGIIQSTNLSDGAISRMRHFQADNTPYDLGDNPLRDEFKHTERGRIEDQDGRRLDADNNASTP
ncbi:MAG: hypothetical protein U0905_15850 [Pirellulales bacterium]